MAKRVWDVFMFNEKESKRRKLATGGESEGKRTKGKLGKKEKNRKLKDKCGKLKLKAAPLTLLPQQEYDSVGKMTLCLDLDNTLLHATKSEMVFKRGERRLVELPMYKVAKRPGLDEFLREMASRFELVLFTCASEWYAKRLLKDVLDPEEKLFKHVLTRRSCTLIEGEKRTKDLSLLGREMKKVLIVDDTPASFRLNPENAIHIPSFKNKKREDASDMQLQAVAEYLKRVSSVPKFR